MLRTTRCIKLTTFFALTVLLAAPLCAAPATGGVADVLLGTTQVDWVPNSPMVAYSLVVSGPDGVVERNFEAGETPTFNLAALAGDVDGSYSWQLTATPELSAESRRLMAEARATGTTFNPKDLPPRDELIQSGHFRVMDGAIVQPSANPEPELGIATGGEARNVVSDAVQFVAAADQVIPDDLIVQGSLCVGFDCTNGEVFSFDTIRLKENNLRIKFDDTSTSGSFPSNDWQITINDSANGGASYYRIEDITNSRVPFTIEANTPNNTLYVDQTGRVGIGTTLPVVKLHLQDGNTPGLRLQQDTSSGFGAQTWDVAGNEANFFVRDATNGSRLPFRIKPGAPSSSLFIAADGSVGVGVTTPAQDLHVTDQGDANTNTAIRMSTANHAWDFATIEGNGSFRISKEGTGVTELDLSSSGNLTISGTLTVQGGGGATVPDYVFAPDYELLPLGDLKKFIAENGHLPRIPSQADFDKRGGINMTEMQMLLWEKVEELTLYTLDQQEVISSLHDANELLQSRLSELEQRADRE